MSKGRRRERQVASKFRRQHFEYSDYMFHNYPHDGVPLWLVYDRPLKHLLIDEGGVV